MHCFNVAHLRTLFLSCVYAWLHGLTRSVPGLANQVIQYIQLPIRFQDLQDGQFKYRMEEWPILDVHSIMHYLVDTCGLRIPDSAVRKYWNHNRIHGERWAQDVDPLTLPLGLFGDGATMRTAFGAESLVGIFANLILWTPPSIRHSRFLLFCIPEDKLWGFHTLNKALRRISWSFDCLIHGRHPTVGVYGEPLTGSLQKLSGRPFSRKYALTEVRGDWSWLKKIFRWERTSWNSIQVCHMCRAKSASANPRDLYWSYHHNDWNSPLTFQEYLDERMPSSGI